MKTLIKNGLRPKTSISCLPFGEESRSAREIKIAVGSM